MKTLARDDFYTAPLRRWHSSMRNFLNAELQAARTFLALANGASNRQAVAEYFRHACDAYQTVQHFVGRVPLTRRQEGTFQQRLADLKWKLDIPERTFDDSPNDLSRIQAFPLDQESSQFGRNVAKFLALCERLRVEACQTLKLNQQLIKQNQEIFRRLNHLLRNRPARLPSPVLLAKP